MISAEVFEAAVKLSNALPLDQLPDGWFWEVKNTFHQQAPYQCWCILYDYTNCLRAEGYACTPRGAMLAAIEQTKRKEE